MESEEASSDDTTIISELLNSPEAMQQTCSSLLPSAITNVSTINVQLQQKDELQIVPNTSGMSATFCNATKQNLIVPTQPNHGIVTDNGLFNSTQYQSDMEELSKMHMRHVHIPYILNGELYQIQTQDGENVTVKCCHCPPDRVYRGSVRSTGNFHMHIKRRHPDLLEKLHDMKVNALLERRDRLMRNRKVSHRHNRNLPNSTNVNSSDMCSFKNEENPELNTNTPGTQINLDSTPELSLMHTHKLKIKTVFQRHQMQQKQATEMRNWNNANCVVMPIGKLPTTEQTEQPINYSLKSQENHEIQSLNVQQQPTQQEKSKSHDIITETSFKSFLNSNNHPTNLSFTNNGTKPNEYITENHTNNRNLSCPSVMSSYSSSHQYDMEANRIYNNFSLQHNNLTIIKPEHLSVGAETEAIDLTYQTDSGIFSNSEDNDSQNNIEASSINNNRAGTQKANTTTIDVEHNSKSYSNNDNAKWQELLGQVESSLQDIQREMNVRNQIESNRIFLDIAKFKFLNPGFQFNW